MTHFLSGLAAVGIVVTAISLSLFLSIPLSLIRTPLIEPDLMADVVRPYVEVDSQQDECIGAGTVISWQGKVYILTAGHVVEDHKVMHLRKELENGKGFSVWTATIVAMSFNANEDLGLLVPDNEEGLTPANYTGTVTLKRGQDAWYIGTPGGLHALLERTIISRPFYNNTGAAWEVEDPRNAYRIAFNGNGWYGNSGGGLFVLDKGRFTLVGVVVELLRPGEKAPLGAVTQEEITNFLIRSTK